jgi:hypothetical protein
MPKSIRHLAMVRGTDGLLRLEMVDAGREVVLDPLAELVWIFLTAHAASRHGKKAARPH